MNKYEHIRSQAYNANVSLPEFGLVKFTFGNASAADHHLRVFAIKPSGVPYELLTPDNMVIVNFDGEVVEGDMRPSSDTPTHAALYRHWPQVGGICHTHSTYATAWAQAQQDIPIYGTTHADHFSGDIPCVPRLKDRLIASDYENQTGLQITDYLDEQKLDPVKLQMVLLAHHAPFTWGRTAGEAVYNSAVLEEIAQLAFLTFRINMHASRAQPALIEKHFNRKHGKKAYYGQINNK